jgi:hypothetical protein
VRGDNLGKIKKAYLVGSIVVSHLCEVLLEDLLIESCLAHVYDL